jgi:hypothetical protein
MRKMRRLRSASKLLLGAAPVAATLLGCSNQLQLGNDVVWGADHEPGSLEQWTGADAGAAQLPSADATIAISTENAHSGNHSLKLVNPAAWPNTDEGPELFHDVGPLDDAYYSAWFLLPEQYRIEPWLTLMRLSSRDDAADGLHSAEELQLRSLASGGYALQVFNNNAGFLLEPLADPVPRVEPGRWFQIEARLEPQAEGRLRVWLDGQLAYDLRGRPGATGHDQVLTVANIAETSTPAPLVLYVDDAAVSLSRVSPAGKLHD